MSALARRAPSPAVRGHWCHVCGVEAGFGLGPPAVPATHERWFCRSHAPEGFLAKPPEDLF